MQYAQFFIIIVSFLFYFIIHSLMASLWFKKWLFSRYPAIEPYYRLLFNLVAVVLLLPLVLVMWLFPGQTLWQWQGWQDVVADGLAVLAAIGFFLSLKDYDLQEFAGLRQLRDKQTEALFQEKLSIGFFHRFVRHPWYFFLLLILWTRDMTQTSLLATICITLYLITGSYLEEQKLIAFFGRQYEIYRQRVAGLIPLPWRYLTVAEAAELISGKKPSENKSSENTSE